MTLPSQALLVARDGREIPIGDSASPIQTADGTLLGIVVVFRDTTAERDAERQRAAALEREQAARRTAESLSRAKDEFVATVSHELRTPLNAIFGWVAMLRLGALDADGQAKALDVIDRNTRVQAQLIEDLLDMARVIRGTVRLEMLPVDLAVAVESAVDAVKPAADARRVDAPGPRAARRRVRLGRHEPPAAGRVEPALERHQVLGRGRRSRRHAGAGG